MVTLNDRQRTENKRTTYIFFFQALASLKYDSYYVLFRMFIPPITDNESLVSKNLRCKFPWLCLANKVCKQYYLTNAINIPWPTVRSNHASGSQHFRILPSIILHWDYSKQYLSIQVYWDNLLDNFLFAPLIQLCIQANILFHLNILF